MYKQSQRQQGTSAAHKNQRKQELMTSLNVCCFENTCSNYQGSWNNIWVEGNGRGDGPWLRETKMKKQDREDILGQAWGLEFMVQEQEDVVKVTCYFCVIKMLANIHQYSTVIFLWRGKLLYIWGHVGLCHVFQHRLPEFLSCMFLHLRIQREEF